MTKALSLIGSFAAALIIAPPALADLVLVDVGTTAGSTVSSGGQQWNTMVGAGPLIDLLTTTGSNSGIDLTVTAGGFGLNGGTGAGGLVSPNPALLGDLAVTSATGDYFFSQGFTLTLSGLDVSRLYSFEFVGSRAAGDTRQTGFTVTGATTDSVSVLTTGTDIGADLGAPAAGTAAGDPNVYDGFDGTGGVPAVASIQPNGSGVITIEVVRQAGSNAYLNAFSISSVAAIPEPTTTLAMSAIGAAFMVQRRRPRMN